MSDLIEKANLDNGFVRLNVGDSRYTTTLATLKRFPDSMLGAMFSGRHVLHADIDGFIVIDRDGKPFQHILSFLRDPMTYNCAHLTPSELMELRREVEYFGLTHHMFPNAALQGVERFVQQCQIVLQSYSYVWTIKQSGSGLWYTKRDREHNTCSAYQVVLVCNMCKSGYPLVTKDVSFPNFFESRQVCVLQPIGNCHDCPNCKALLKD